MLTRQQTKILKKINIDSDSGCWVWMGARKSKERIKSYGVIVEGLNSVGNPKRLTAHRYAYEAFVGEIPEGLFVCHTCDNPPCVNPKHLFTGTHQDNVDDRERKGRNNTECLRSFLGEKHPNSKLNWDNVREIRHLFHQHGWSNPELAEVYRVHKRTISDVIRRATWKIDPIEQ